MKFSKYNVLFSSKKYGHLIYNSLSNSFAEIDYKLFEQLNILKNDVSSIENIDVELKEVLISKKILVENDLDEYYNLKLQTLISRFNEKVLSLTIAPTRDCNFNCIYCYERERPAIYINENTIENLVNFIKSYNYVKFLNICWYGGEPLLAFDRIIEISKKLDCIDKKYNSFLITNGYLLNKNICEKLADLNITSIQITLDGTKETHDKRRFLKGGEETFDSIINNIEYLLEVNNLIQIYIRCNIDLTNFEEFNKLKKLLNNRFKNNSQINIYPGFVDNPTSCLTNSNCLFNRNQKINFLLEQYKKYQIKDLNYYPPFGRSECMARHINSYLVDPDGKLYKCWNDIGEDDKSIGSINTKGSKNQHIHTRYLTAADQIEQEECKNCNLFPICVGGCPYSRIFSLYKNEKSETCDIRKGNLIKFLEIHYEIKKNIKNELHS